MEKNGKNKEEWIDAVLKSTSGIVRPEAPAHLYSKMEQRLKRKIGVAPGNKIISIRVVSIAAAVVFLLMSVNLYFLSRQYKTTKNSDIKQVASYYDIAGNNNLMDNL